MKVSKFGTINSKFVRSFSHSLNLPFLFSIRLHVPMEKSRKLIRWVSYEVSTMEKKISSKNKQQIFIKHSMRITMELLVGREVFFKQRSSISFSRNVDLREFLIGFALTSTGSVREKLKYVFRTYDHDKDGVINKKEIDRMVKVRKIGFLFMVMMLFSFRRLPLDFMRKMILRIRRVFLMN